MAVKEDKNLIYLKVQEYLVALRENHIPVWRVYLYGSCAKGTFREDSDIDLAVFWDRDHIDGFDEDVQLLKLTKKIDLRIEPHSFARPDFDDPDPFVAAILKTGERVF
ncbi:MAG: nucleotidyltransferase domain-containing protein [Nitrospirae bacterium]|nr:nucleotidyltransferase domain-containing protein [Nitrospirota bacterium]